VTNEIHHYCSPSVFLSLITNKQLWLTSLSQSNDQLEGTWMLRHWLDKFDVLVEKIRLQKMGAKIVVEMALEGSVALGTCFSEDRDLLSQWRGYASDGAGFSVTFDREKLQNLANGFEGGSSLALSKISYGFQDHIEIDEVVKTLHSAFASDAELYQEDGGFGRLSIEFNPEKHEQQKAAVRSMFTVKNGAFKEEREWRLFLYDSINRIKSVEFRESRNVLSPYVRVEVPVDAILGVTLGPTNRTSKSMVEAALERHQISCQVFRSKASYRNN
jgi:hypothetical protein